MRVSRKRTLQSAHDQSAHQTRVPETHFGLRGMHVHVHEFRIAFHKQRECGVSIMREEVGVGAAYRPEQKPVANGSAVHRIR